MKPTFIFNDTFDGYTMTALRAILFFLLLLIFPRLAFGTTVADNFNRADSSDIGTDWDSGYNSSDSCEILNNAVIMPAASASGNGVCVETWGTNSFTSDQFAQVTLSTWQGSVGGSANIFLKASGGPPDRTWYRCAAFLLNGSFKTQVQKRVANTTVDSGSENTSGNWSAGDVLKCTAEGTSTVTVKAYRNSTLVLTYTDSTSPLSGGLIGLGVGSVTGGTPAEIVIDNFSGGDMTAPTGVVRRRIVIGQ